MARPDLILHQGPAAPDLLIHHDDPFVALHGIILRMEAAREHFTRLGDGSVICVRPEGTARITLTPRALELRLSADEAGAQALRAQFEALFQDVPKPLSLKKESLG